MDTLAFDILSIISSKSSCRRGPVTLVELNPELGWHSHDVSIAVRELERQGLIQTRGANPTHIVLKTEGARFLKIYRALQEVSVEASH